MHRGRPRRIGAPRSFAESRPITIADLDLAPPGDTQHAVRIRPRASATICPSSTATGSVSADAARPTRPPGSSNGSAALRRQDLAVGQRVVMTFLPRCGDCSACATDGLAPYVEGSAAGGAGTLLAGGRALPAATAPRSCITSVSRRSPPPSSAAGRSCRSTRTCRRWWPPCSRCSPAVAPSQRRPPTQGRPWRGRLGGSAAAMLTALAHDGVRVVAVDQVRTSWIRRSSLAPARRARRIGSATSRPRS